MLPPEADGPTADAALRSLQTYVADEARGQGEALLIRGEDPIKAISERARDYDLVVLGITRSPGGKSQIGELLGRVVQGAPCPVLIISHPAARGIGPRR